MLPYCWSPRVLAAPEPAVWIKGLGDNGIELELTTWIHDAEQGQSSLHSDIFIDVLRAFSKERIEIPYPRREIRILTDGPEADLHGPMHAQVPTQNFSLNQ